MRLQNCFAQSVVESTTTPGKKTNSGLVKSRWAVKQNSRLGAVPEWGAALSRTAARQGKTKRKATKRKAKKRNAYRAVDLYSIPRTIQAAGGRPPRLASARGVVHPREAPDLWGVSIGET